MARWLLVVLVAVSVVSAPRTEEMRSLALIALSVAGAIVFVSSPVGAQQTNGEWIEDRVTGCKVWNSNPEPNERISWSGACVGGVAQGLGVVQWFKDGKPNGQTEGDYRAGKIEGRGVSVSANGNRYEGDWRDGKRHGRGILTGANGDRYDGEWRDGKPNGFGTLTRAARNEIFTGTWSNGCFRQMGAGRWAAIGVTKEECVR